MVQGGISRLEPDTSSQKRGTTTGRFQRQLTLAARSKAAQAAALHVYLDVRTLSYCDGQSGMRHFAQTIFETGQSVPENEPFERKSYQPRCTDETKAVKDLSHKYGQDLASEFRKGSLQYSGAIKIEVVHLKVQGKHFYDFTLYFMEVSDNGPFQKPTFKIRNITLLVVEMPNSPTTKNIKSFLSNTLMVKYELSMDHFFPRFYDCHG